MGRRTAAKRHRRAMKTKPDTEPNQPSPEFPSLEELKARLRKIIDEYTQSGGRLTVRYMPTQELLRRRMEGNEHIPTVYIQTKPNQPNEQLPITSYSSHFNLTTITENDNPDTDVETRIN